MWFPLFVQPITAIFEDSAASAREAPLTQEPLREGLHISCMIRKPSASYHSIRILCGIQMKLALIIDANFIVETNGRNGRVQIEREDDLQLE